MEPWRRKVLASLGANDPETEARKGVDYLCVVPGEIVRLAKLQPPTFPRLLDISQIAALFEEPLGEDGDLTQVHCAFTNKLAEAVADGRIPDHSEWNNAGQPHRALHFARVDRDGVRAWLQSAGVTLPANNLLKRWLDSSKTPAVRAKEKHARIRQRASELRASGKQRGIAAELAREFNLSPKTILNILSKA